MTTIKHNNQPKVELDSELGTSDVQPLARMGIYSKEATCGGSSGGYHSNIRCERAGDGGGTWDLFSKSPLDGTVMRPFQHHMCSADVVERCGR